MCEEVKNTEAFEIREPTGEKVLSKANPRVLNREEFERSPDVLFHGTKKPFVFKQAFDYHSVNYLEENDGSATLGMGFYTTPNRQEAEGYSKVRQPFSPEELTTPIVVPILPYEARVLDLRARSDVSRNAPVAQDLVQRWLEKYRGYYTTKKPREGNLGAIFDSMESEYHDHLVKIKNTPVDLRELLYTTHWPSPGWAALFSDFMLEQGYDGLVFNEGG